MFLNIFYLLVTASSILAPSQHNASDTGGKGHGETPAESASVTPAKHLCPTKLFQGNIRLGKGAVMLPAPTC